MARPARSSGSSPLARGLHVGDADGHPGRRIIPARAGFTTSPAGADPSAEDHPRSRGVYAPVTIQVTGAAGSSPLARGLRPRPADPDAHARIIPARAGFTSSPGAVGSSLSDHPRSRGVYGPSSAPGRRAPGSSPLARGLQITLYSPDDGTGIIPARAGFTVLSTGQVTVDSDHPRSRGVYRLCGDGGVQSPGSSPLARGLPASTWTTPATAGSSPLARGLPAAPFPKASPDGIIPARAGFTARGPGRRAPAQDHPRSRGVYLSSTRMRSHKRGSSPLARGLLTPAEGGLRRERIIPARAGFTRSRSPTAAWRRDHPRSRGVYTSVTPRPSPRRGSSPLARGLPLDTTAQTSAQGIIPARAGFTVHRRAPGGVHRDHPRSRGVYSRQ